MRPPGSAQLSGSRGSRPATSRIESRPARSVSRTTSTLTAISPSRSAGLSCTATSPVPCPSRRSPSPVLGAGLSAPLTRRAPVAARTLQRPCGSERTSERAGLIDMGITSQFAAIRVLAGAGAARPSRPDRLLGMGLALLRWGFTPAAGWAAGAARYPHQPAIIDELGIDDASARSTTPRSAVATGLIERGVPRRRFGRAADAQLPVDADRRLSAVAKAGADAVLLNTGFGAAAAGRRHDARGHSGRHP